MAGMRDWLKMRLNYANVVATLALFLALGGGTALALKGKNTVNSGDIINGQVRSVDLHKPKVIRVADNPGTTSPASPDPCASGKTAIFCGGSNSAGSFRGWLNYQDVAGPDEGPFGPVSFWLDNSGLVHLSGELGSVFPIEVDALVLPKAYRPKHVIQFAVAVEISPDCGGINCETNDAVVQIDPSGAVTEPVGSNVDGASLEGITYRAG